MESYRSKANDDDWRYKTPHKPNAEGFLPVSTNPEHKIYWHEYGNPQGEPVIFIHGGPGGGTRAREARFFNPERYRIVMFDQRGCGGSLPSTAVSPELALQNNTTAHSISDIEKLRAHLGIEGKMHFFGGSWGSTLSLCYAIAHPENVASLTLRGIFLCRKKDIDYFYQGNAANYELAPLDTSIPGAYAYYPEAWKEYVQVIPPEKRGDMIAAYAEVFAATPASEAERIYQDKAAAAWSIWEGATSYLAQDLTALQEFAEPEFAKTFAKIENHYFLNGAFFGGKTERDNNYILENVGTIAHLPIAIVHGIFDQVCPRFQADELVAELKRFNAPHLRYFPTAAGHSALERENMLKLTEIMDNLPEIKTALAFSGRKL